MQAIFETAIAVLTADREFGAAAQTAETYKAVAEGNRDREKHAEVLAAWAKDLASKKTTEADAREKFAAAATEYLALAGEPGAPSVKAHLLKRAGGLYRLAGNLTAALTTYSNLVQLKSLPEDAAGPAWAEYADTLAAANMPSEALRAFNQAMAAAGPASTMVRFTLGRKLIDTRHKGLVPIGTDLLKQITDKESVAPAEQAVHERAFVELGFEYIRSSQSKEAETVLRKQLNYYRAGPESGFARLLLGIALLNQCARPAPATPEPAKSAQYREEALKLFHQVIDEVNLKEKSLGEGQKLDDRDVEIRSQASLRVLQTYLEMGKPNDLLVEAAPMLARYQGMVEELIVLSFMYHANKLNNRPELALKTRDRMKEAFEKLKLHPDLFKTTSENYTRDYWEKTWFSPESK